MTIMLCLHFLTHSNLATVTEKLAKGELKYPDMDGYRKLAYYMGSTSQDSHLRADPKNVVNGLNLEPERYTSLFIDIMQGFMQPLKLNLPKTIFQVNVNTLSH